MKPYIIKNNEFLKYFSKLPQKDKIHLIPTLNRNQLNTISEICKNFLKKNLTKCPKIIKKVKLSQKEIKAIALKRTPLCKKKKKLQSRSGGVILSVILPLAASLIGSHNKKIMKEYILIPKKMFEML